MAPVADLRNGIRLFVHRYKAILLHQSGNGLPGKGTGRTAYRLEYIVLATSAVIHRYSS